MKYVTLMLLSLSTFAHAGEITLSPGSSATIRPGETTTVTCSGEALGGTALCTCEKSGSYILLMYRANGIQRQVQGWWDNGINELIACKSQMKKEYKDLCF
jgi:hypothetical protein